MKLQPAVLRVALALTALLVAASACAAPAPAAITHSPNSVTTFGPDGGPQTELNSFYYLQSREIKFDNESQRLYLLRPELWGFNGQVPPQPPRGIFAFDMATQGTYTPLIGSFPIPLEEGASNSHFAVDESEGNIYFLNTLGESSGELFSWDRSGQLRPGFPKTIEHDGYMAVDPLGYLWVLQQTYLNEAVLYKYDPEGNLLTSVDASAATGGGQGPISFNSRTGDLWVNLRNHAVRLTAASGFTEGETFSMPGEPAGALVVDAKDGVLYDDIGTAIVAYNESGDRLEEIGLGERNKENSWRADRPRPSAPYFTNYVEIAYNESSGDLYAIDDRRVGPMTGFGPDGEALGSNIAVWQGAEVPGVSIGSPSSVGHTDATLTGHVTPDGDGDPVTSCEFEYITEAEREGARRLEVRQATGGTFTLAHLGPYGEQQSSEAISYNATAAEVQSALAGPTEGKAVVTGPAGGPWRIELNDSRPEEFGQPGAPLRASLLTVATNEMLPLAADVRLDWDAKTAPCSPAASAGAPLTNGTDVSAGLSGLETGTTYRFRLAASDKDGRSVSTSSTFTPSPSLVSTGPATEITFDGAKLNGTVDPEGQTTTFYFEYGTSAAYGQTTSAPPGEDVGTTAAGAQPVGATVAGLIPQTVYHYRVVAVNGKGTSYGVDRTFETAATVKSVTTDPASEVERTSAQLNGSLDPDGQPTTYYFEWGKSRRYGNTSAAPPGVSSGSSTPGIQHLDFVAEGLEPDTTYHFRIVATNADGVTAGQDRTFRTPKAIKNLVTEPATDIKVDGATLHGELDPDGFQTDYVFEWGKTVAYGRTSPASPQDVGTTAPGPVQLETELENLEPGVTYHYRLVGTNAFGTTVGGDLSFKTPQPPSIESFSSSHVTATGAELEAKINPHGVATTYRFEYGTSIAYGSSVSGTLGTQETGQPVKAVLTDLEAGRTYHFRVVAENVWGVTVSEDQSFGFFPPTCPNATVRQRTGSAYLPDCRAYELVSPERAGGALIEPSAPSSALAQNHFSFTGGFTVIPGAGDQINAAGMNLYDATRTPEGWKTQYIGLTAKQTIEQAPKPREYGASGPYSVPTNSELTRFLTWNHSSLAVYSYSPYMWDSESNYLGRLPTNVEEVPGGLTKPSEGGYKGDIQPSGDFSHYVFSSIRTAFAPGGVTESPGSVYDNDIATGSIQVVSKTAGGEDIPQDPQAGVVGEYIQIPAVSTDGSHILMSTEAPNEQVHLYMWANGVNYDVSVGEDGINHGVKLAGMTSDGSAVYFTTAARMTSDDVDSSTDLYKWSSETDSLTRLSVGVEGNSGNSDNCNPGWTERCGVVVVPTEHESNRYEGLPRDSSIASSAGDVYFYSPEQLDFGARGVEGQRNLYVWHDGTVRYVTTIAAVTPIESINVAPNGAFAGFITKTQVTPYDNASHAEMYRYNSQTGGIVCVSCIPDGTAPTADVQGALNGIFLTEAGRAFFSTTDSLTPRDDNESIDVYEYAEGRPQLITSGTGQESPSTFQLPGLIGVNSNGTNAYFYTSQVLVPQDENGPFYKIYDARVNGGFEVPTRQAPCAAADECHGESSEGPPPPRIGTTAHLGGSGNLHPPKAKKHRHRRKKHRKHRHHHSRGKGGSSR